MRVALDTNILTRSIQPDSSQHHIARNAIRRLRMEGHELCVFPQVLYEFWVVCTRPHGENGLALTPVQVSEELDSIRGLFSLLAAHESALLACWETLVRTHEVRGKAGHDARIVAAMQLQQVPAILTFNGSDFARYEDIRVLSPEQLLSAET